MMKKFIAAIAALLLLSVLLVIQFPDALTEDIVTVNQKSPLAEPVIIVEKTSLKQDLDNLSIKEKVLNNDLIGDDLRIYFYLRNHFDDIIHQHKQKDQSLEILLAKLSVQLNLHQQADNRLKELFYRYRKYLLAITELKSNAPAIDGMIDISESQIWLQHLYALQYKLFTESEILVFFTKEKNYDQQVLSRLAIRQDLSLSKAQREVLVEHQISQLEPEELAALKPTLLAQKIASLLTYNGSNYADIDSELTVEQIDRINMTREKNALWKDKMKAYRETVTANPQLDQDGILEDMRLYQQQKFSKNELKRLQVFLKNPQLWDES